MQKNVQPITDKLLILPFLLKTVLIRKTEEKGFGCVWRTILHNITSNKPHLTFGRSLEGKCCMWPVRRHHQHTCLALYTSALEGLLYLRCWEWEQAVMLLHTMIFFHVCVNSLCLSCQHEDSPHTQSCSKLPWKSLTSFSQHPTIQNLWDELEYRLWAGPRHPASMLDLVNAVVAE